MIVRHSTMSFQTDVCMHLTNTFVNISAEQGSGSPTGAVEKNQFTEIAETADVLVLNLLDYR